MEIVVNDTNIFIDLYSIGCLDAFFRLPICVHTIDFVMNEITNAEQLKAIEKYVLSKQLAVGTFTAEELASIYTIQATAKGNVSFTDCAVLHYAKSNDYVLLTGDRQLRDKATEANVTVRGILYVFDLFMQHQILPAEKVVAKLQELQETNQRLPKRLIQERLEKWRRF